MASGAVPTIIVRLACVARKSRAGGATRRWAPLFPIRLSGTIDVLIPAHGPGYLRTPRILGKLESVLARWHVEPRHITKKIDSISFRTSGAAPFRHGISSGQFVVDRSGTRTLVHFSLSFWRLAAGTVVALAVAVYRAYEQERSVGWSPLVICALYYCVVAALAYLRFRSGVERLLKGLRPEAPLLEVLPEQLSHIVRE